MSAEKFGVLQSIIRKMFARLRVKNSADEERSLRLEEKLTLGPKKMLYLVHCKGRDLVVAAGADSIVSVMELSPVEPSVAKPRPRLEKQARLS